MPVYFKQTKFASFQRQLNIYGFIRLTTGKDKGGYYHEFFLRHKLILCENIIRTEIKGTGVKAKPSPDTEPDFYSMSFVEPDPPDTITAFNVSKSNCLKDDTVSTMVEDGDKLMSKDSPSQHRRSYASERDDHALGRNKTIMDMTSSQDPDAKKMPRINSWTIIDHGAQSPEKKTSIPHPIIKVSQTKSVDLCAALFDSEDVLPSVEGNQHRICVLPHSSALGCTKTSRANSLEIFLDSSPSCENIGTDATLEGIELDPEFLSFMDE